MSKKLPTYRRHPNGQAFFEYRGQRTYLGKYDSPESKERFNRVISQILAGGPGAVAIKPQDTPKIATLINTYLDHAARYYTKDGKATKEYLGMEMAVRKLGFFYGESLAIDFGPAKLMELQQCLIGSSYKYASGRGKQRVMIEQRYTRPYINKLIGRVKRFFRWCAKNELIPPEQYHRLYCVEPLMAGRCAAPEPPDVEPVPRAIVEQTIPYMQPMTAAMVQLQMLCGMRPAEICAMRGRDIEQHDGVWVYTVPEHKTAWRGMQLVKAIPLAAQRILQPFLLDDPDAYIFSPIVSESRRHAVRRRNRETPLTPSQQARRPKKSPKSAKRPKYDTDSYRKAIRYAIDKAARAGVVIPHWHPNQLRHTIATEIRETMSEQAAQIYLGHACLETTAIYAKKNLSELLSVARELDRQWASAAAPERP